MCSFNTYTIHKHTRNTNTKAFNASLTFDEPHEQCSQQYLFYQSKYYFYSLFLSSSFCKAQNVGK